MVTNVYILLTPHLIEGILRLSNSLILLWNVHTPGAKNVTYPNCTDGHLIKHWGFLRTVILPPSERITATNLGFI